MALPSAEDAGKALAGVVPFLLFVGKTWTVIQAKRGAHEKRKEQANPKSKDSYDNLQEDNLLLRQQLAEANDFIRQERQRTNEERQMANAERLRADELHAKLHTRQLAMHDLYTLFRTAFFRLQDKGMMPEFQDLADRVTAIQKEPL